MKKLLSAIMIVTFLVLSLSSCSLIDYFYKTMDSYEEKVDKKYDTEITDDKDDIDEYFDEFPSEFDALLNIRKNPFDVICIMKVLDKNDKAVLNIFECEQKEDARKLLIELEILQRVIKLAASEGVDDELNELIRYDVVLDGKFVLYGDEDVIEDLID